MGWNRQGKILIEGAKLSVVPKVPQFLFASQSGFLPVERHFRRRRAAVEKPDRLGTVLRSLTQISVPFFCVTRLAGLPKVS